MHGRLKVYTTEEQKLIKKKEQQKEVIAYRSGVKHVLESRKPDGYDSESLRICAKILNKQPDVYTLWNYRKEAVLVQLARNEVNSEGDNEALTAFLQDELQLTQQCLMTNPKSYGSWHHRFWILARHPQPNWETEFSLCTQYLTMDERNFHCWDYRRLILNKVGVPLFDEISFSTDRININFSNYSSWHYRSTLKFLNSDSLLTELAFIQNALFTDPYDTSTWFYFKWVLNDPNVTCKIREDVLDSLNQLLEMEPECRWILIAKCWLILNKEDKVKCNEKLAELDVLRAGRYLEN